MLNCNACRLVLSLDLYNDVLNRQKDKDLQIKQLVENQTTQTNKLKDMEIKFQQILSKINIEQVMSRMS